MSIMYTLSLLFYLFCFVFTASASGIAISGFTASASGFTASISGITSRVSTCTASGISTCAASGISTCAASGISRMISRIVILIAVVIFITVCTAVSVVTITVRIIMVTAVVILIRPCRCILIRLLCLIFRRCLICLTVQRRTAFCLSLSDSCNNCIADCLHFTGCFVIFIIIQKLMQFFYIVVQFYRNNDTSQSGNRICRFFKWESG